MDKRHQRRLKVVQELYGYAYNKHQSLSEKAEQVVEHKKVIDRRIERAAPKYAIAKIAKVDLSILRLAVFELIYENKVPPKVVINEAVELAHEMAGVNSPGFVNAVLGAIYEVEQKKQTKN